MFKKEQRLLSLDVFRGLTIAGMILVNTPGSWSYVYPPLRHASWHGCTPTDLVFPFFLLIVGVSMRFSFARLNYSWSKDSVGKLLKRGLIIFIIGLLLNAFPFIGLDPGHLRIMGVLQRIALAFMFGGLLVLGCQGRRNYIVLITVLLLLGYWLIIWVFASSMPFGLETNVARDLDLLIIGENHMYKGFGLPFDPEGLLSTIPSTGTVLIGFLVGERLQKKPKSPKELLVLVAIGVIMLTMGWLWGLVFPINKPLWTSSYVLFTGGIAITILSIFYWLVDVKGFKSWGRFFEIFGVNPLFGFVLSIIWVKTIIKLVRIENTNGDIYNGYSWLYQECFVPIAGSMNGSLLFAVSHVFFFWLILLMLYRYKIYIKI